jgi:ATP-dependent DNA helicase PIF1
MIRKSPKAMRRWLMTDLLIIDEISMMTDELLEKLDGIGKRIRGNKLPFGGIQLLFVGDFYQLPPVITDKDRERRELKSSDTCFAFQTPIWNECIREVIELTVLHRQTDPVFRKILNEVRIGELSNESREILESRVGHEWSTLRIRPTLLFPRRSDVETINESNLTSLKGKSVIFKAKTVYNNNRPAGFNVNDSHFLKAIEYMDRDAPYKSELILMEGAQVMLICNYSPEEGLVNGSRGVVSGFDSATGEPVVEFVNGKKLRISTWSWEIDEYEFAMRVQIPLQLAWAATIHKSQGVTLDSALIDIGHGTFEYGQAYVALSRVKSLESLYIYTFIPSAIRTHPRVKEFYARLCKK